MVEVLGAPFLVDADGLQRRRLAAGDADVFPGWRDAQLGDPGQDLFVLHRGAVGEPERESSFLGPLAADAVEIEIPAAADSRFA